MSKLMPKWKETDKKDVFFFVAFVFVVIAVFCLLNGGNASGNDGFWHMKMGRWIFNNLSIPHFAVGAWGGEDLYWLPQEWLYEVFLYGVCRNNMTIAWFLTMFIVAVGFIMIGVLTKLYKDIFSKPVGLVVFGYCFLFCMLSSVAPRPQTVSIFLLAIFVYLFRSVVLTGEVNKRKYVIFFVLSVLWSNLHAGSAVLGYLIPLGVVVCYYIGLYLLKFDFLSIPFDMSVGKNALQRATWVCVMMLIGNFCTPHGIAGFLYPFMSMSDSLMLNVISEWRQPVVHDMVSLCVFYFPFLAFILWLLFKKVKNIVFYDVLIISCCALLTLLHIRMDTYMFVVMALLIVPYCPSISFKTGYKTVSVLLSVLFIFVSCIGIVWSASRVTFVSEGLGNTEFFDVVKDQSGDRLYNYYDIGSILEYYDIPVWIDARYDPFSEERMHDFVNLYSSDSQSSGFDDVMSKYDFTSLLDRRGSSILYWAEDHGYRKVAEWDTGTTYTNKYGEVFPCVYEFWIK